ncbi:MAG: ABC transporter permease [Vampirovibrionia bacterium]
MLNRIITLIIKELLSFMGDKQTRLLLIGPPLMQLLVFSFAATLDVKNINIAIVNNDYGLESQELIHRFEASKSFNQILFIKGTKEIKDALDSQKAIYILQIDSTFSKNIQSGTPANIQFLLDGRKTNVSQIALGYANTIVEEYISSLPKKQKIQKTKTEIIVRNWFNPNLTYLWFTVPCLVGIITMLLGLLVTSLSVAKERELGTFDQLLVSPLKPFEILIGKTIPAFIIGTIEGSFMIVVAIIILRIPFYGNFLYLYGGILVFLSSIIGVGLFISSISKTQQQAILGAFVVMMPAVLLSGYATPIENMPAWFQTITYINPLRYFMVITKGTFLKDIPLEVVLANTWPLVIIALFTLTLAGWFFNRRLE